MGQQIESKRKISARSALLIGLLIGLVTAGAAYSLTSINAQTNATTNTTNNPYYPHIGHPEGDRDGAWFHNATYSMTSFRAVSRVQNVTITGFNITSSTQLTLYLKHTGSGSSPAITIVAMSHGLSGSTVLQAGWSSPDTVTVNLVGSGSLSSYGCTSVLVVPYTG